MFDIKDSGKRAQFNSGMQRDVTDDKIDYTLAVDGPMFQRYAVHLTNGAKKYDKRNWMKANSEEELDRFRQSAFRHFMQWFNGDRDEDHAAAVWFNINGAEYVREKLASNAEAGTTSFLDIKTDTLIGTPITSSQPVYPYQQDAQLPTEFTRSSNTDKILNPCCCKKHKTQDGTCEWCPTHGNK